VSAGDTSNRRKTMTKTVLIAGAGPVGLTMACELARYGVNVRIIDKAAQRTDKSKALVVWSRTLELLDRGGGSAPFIDAGFKVDAVNFLTGEKVVGHVSMDSVQSAYPYALMLPQSETERLLDERLQSLGASVERQVELVDSRTHDDGIEARLRHADGRKESVSADWLVGCDGAHSAVRHGLNAPFAGETMDSDWMLADVHMRGYPCPDTEASVYWHRDGAFIIFPISPGRYRLLADLPPSGAEHPPTPTLEQVQAIIDRRGPPGMVAFDPIWLAGFRINGRKVSNYRWGRVFLCGDAAHIHSPAGGQGMNTGMQDAFNLAWKLALVVRKACGEHLLDSFSAERSKIGDEVLKTAGRLTAVGTMKNPIVQTVRNVVGHLMLGLSPVQHAFAATMTQVSIGYPDSPLNGPSLGGSGPKPGERAVPSAGQVPAGSDATPLFALFAEPNPATTDLTRRFGGVLDPVIRPSLNGKGIWLVRPDGYVACSASNAAIVADYLAGLARPAGSMAA
jgi:2-polyprenyl-6-methoxyphenol hydroxylase-like FAD-dependent oxidoreductase